MLFLLIERLDNFSLKLLFLTIKVILPFFNNKKKKKLEFQSVTIKL